ncbi:MAG: hypothetical protein IPJ38_16045 [Dechloromonas sp.]|uniref:Uncharacterized protein n=1 Tax=Candidatus Dechloromonas phosphorivorans TaxID=2899244 RepID=A0A935JZU6_9RHOO|nr:hypothetical protein [Candidatus Dechloromonas phosphorivorans]
MKDGKPLEDGAAAETHLLEMVNLFLDQELPQLQRLGWWPKASLLMQFVRPITQIGNDSSFETRNTQSATTQHIVLFPKVDFAFDRGTLQSFLSGKA